jgi:hypothetical protein
LPSLPSVLTVGGFWGGAECLDELANRGCASVAVWCRVDPAGKSVSLACGGEGVSSIDADRGGSCKAQDLGLLVRLNVAEADMVRTTHHHEGFSKAFAGKVPIRAASEVKKFDVHSPHDAPGIGVPLASAARPIYRAGMRWLLFGFAGLAASLAGLVAYNARFEQQHSCNCLDSCWCRSRLGRHARWWWPAEHRAPAPVSPTR